MGVPISHRHRTERKRKKIPLFSISRSGVIAPSSSFPRNEIRCSFPTQFPSFSFVRTLASSFQFPLTHTHEMMKRRGSGGRNVAINQTPITKFLVSNILLCCVFARGTVKKPEKTICKECRETTCCVVSVFGPNNVWDYAQPTVIKKFGIFPYALVSLTDVPGKP